MSKRIIVIDDDETILKSYSLILSAPEKDISGLKEKAKALKAELFGGFPAAKTTRENYELVTAMQGEEGFKKVKEARDQDRPFALAFVDIRMPPGWDGLQTSKVIREIDPNIEIVIVTAYSDRERDEIVAEVGMPERLLYLKKPFDPEEIRQLALSLSRKWELERKAEKHRDYLEQLLDSVRRLKTLNISSVKDMLTAILNEVLYFVNARKGYIAKLEQGEIKAEITSEALLPDEIDMINKSVSEKLPDVEYITWIDNIMVFPVKDRFEYYFIMISDSEPPMRDEKLKLLKLLLETSSEVLENVRKQEHYLRNERIATIGQIAAGIIHEINNPLAAIMGASDLSNLHGEKMKQFFEEYMDTLKYPEDASELKKRLEDLNIRFEPDKMSNNIIGFYKIIQNGVSRVKDLMDNIRSFSRISDSFEMRTGNMGEALESTLMLAQNSLKYGVTVHKRWKNPLIARCDIGGLKQVFLNLILNAAQAMKDKGELWITAEKKDGKVYISIKDSGPGIPEPEMNRIFDAFYTTKPDGTGLGLSIVKGIIEKHSGSVRVESELGKGAVFYIEFPDHKKLET
ncbi:MAG: response regulator [Desulfobacterales bacterium]|nr:response regulator [Desulfobacterales bacterium]